MVGINNTDIFFGAILGLILLGYGMITMLVGRIRVGFKGMRKMVLVGIRAKVVSLAYVIGGSIIFICSLLTLLITFSSASVSEGVFVAGLVIGTAITIGTHLAETIIAEFVEHQ